MADPIRAIQVVKKVRDILKAAPQISGVEDSVFRGRVYPVEREDLPAIGVYSGEDLPLGEFGPLQSGRYDWRFVLTTEIGVEGADEEAVEDELFRIRGAIFSRLTGNPQLELPDFVVQIWPGPVNAPEVSNEQQKTTGMLVVNWFVHYVTSETDLGA